MTQPPHCDLLKQARALQPARACIITPRGYPDCSPLGDTRNRPPTLLGRCYPVADSALGGGRRKCAPQFVQLHRSFRRNWRHPAGLRSPRAAAVCLPVNGTALRRRPIWPIFRTTPPTFSRATSPALMGGMYLTMTYCWLGFRASHSVSPVCPRKMHLAVHTDLNAPRRARCFSTLRASSPPSGQRRSCWKKSRTCSRTTRGTGGCRSRCYSRG